MRIGRVGVVALTIVVVLVVVIAYLVVAGLPVETDNFSTDKPKNDPIDENRYPKAYAVFEFSFEINNGVGRYYGKFTEFVSKVYPYVGSEASIFENWKLPLAHIWSDDVEWEIEIRVDGGSNVVGTDPNFNWETEGIKNYAEWGWYAVNNQKSGACYFWDSGTYYATINLWLSGPEQEEATLEATSICTVVVN